MNLKLTRTDYLAGGIFGKLEGDGFSLFTLEHAYPTPGNSLVYLPKVPKGSYVCKKGVHQLKGATYPFTTYEIQNVPDHENILFHSGNTNGDSEGCILLGRQKIGNSILYSRLAFSIFMVKTGNLDEFDLIVD